MELLDFQEKIRRQDVGSHTRFLERIEELREYYPKAYREFVGYCTEPWCNSLSPTTRMILRSKKLVKTDLSIPTEVRELMLR